MSERTVLSKMSVKALGCNPKKAAAKEENDKTPLRLCIIHGIADGVKMGEDNKGSVWSALTGNFEGTNLETGETFLSGKLFLPGGIHESVENAVKAAGENPQVAFALEIRAVRANNPIGYSYQAVPLLKPTGHDPLATIREQIGNRLQIAAPKADPAHSTEKHETAASGRRK